MLPNEICNNFLIIILCTIYDKQSNDNSFEIISLSSELDILNFNCVVELMYLEKNSLFKKNIQWIILEIFIKKSLIHI